MSSVLSAFQSVLSQALTVIIAIGWLVLVGIGLEPDKPLSGGIPGHLDAHQGPPVDRENLLGRLGEIFGWIAFAAFPVILVIVLVWILHAHL
jgi:hypothetical protein